MIHSKRKTISLEENPQGELIVCAPMLVTNLWIAALVKEKKRWIKAKYKLALQRRVGNPPKEVIARKDFF